MTAATVVVCTHNRADIVAHAVKAALAEASAHDAEVLVVDNASTDGTSAVLAGVAHEHGRGRLRVIAEPTLGLSHARNRALAEARGALVAFVDDDAVPRPGWLPALLAPFEVPEAAATGGPVVLAFATAPPPWLSAALHGALSAFDAGTRSCRLRYGERDYPHGANIAFRASAARAVGGFSPDVGLRGTLQLQHEETDLCYRLEAAGGEIHYAPTAIVDHWIATERLTPDWFLGRFHQGGRSAAIFILRNRGRARALWRVRWRYGRDLLRAPYVPRDPIDPERFAAECRRREALGYLSGLVRHAARGV